MELKSAYLIVILLLLETHAVISTPVKTAKLDYGDPFVIRWADLIDLREATRNQPSSPFQKNGTLAYLVKTPITKEQNKEPNPSTSSTDDETPISSSVPTFPPSNSSQVSTPIPPLPPIPKVLPSMQPSSQNISQISSKPLIPPQPPATKISPSMQPTSLPSQTSSQNSSQASSKPTVQPSFQSKRSPTSSPSAVPTAATKEYTTLFASDGIPFEKYGHKMVTDPINNLIVITTLQESGRAFIYTNGMNSTGYKLISELSSPNKYGRTNTGSKWDRFASTVDIYNNSLLIGSPDSNSVYFYLPDPKNGEFILQQTLRPIDITSDSNFGCSISIYGDYAIIGASEDSRKSYLEGSAYVFSKSNGFWRLISILTPQTSLYKFGSTVHMKITQGLVTVMVSADSVVYVYRALGIDQLWPDFRFLRTRTTKFQIPSDRFVAADSTFQRASVGDLDDQIGDLVTRVYFDLESILHPYERFGYTNFGYNLHSTSNFSFISSYAKDGSGEVCAFKRDFTSVRVRGTFELRVPDSILSASNNSFPGDRFGYSIASRDSDQMIIIGAPDNALNTNNANGKVYLFDMPQSNEILRGQNGSNRAIKFRGFISNNNSNLRESYGTSIALLGDTLFISAEFGDGNKAFTGVVYPVEKLSQYIFDADKKEEHDSNSYSKNSYESSATRTVGIIILIFIPIVAISILTLFCMNYNKMMCKNISGIPEHNTYSATYADDNQSMDSKSLLVDTRLSLDLNVVHNGESVVLRNLKSIPKKLMGLFNDRNIFSPKRPVKDMAMEESEEECINFDEESNDDKIEEESLIGVSPVSGFEDSLAGNEDVSVESSTLLTLKRINLM